MSMLTTLKSLLLKDKVDDRPLAEVIPLDQARRRAPGGQLKGTWMDRHGRTA